MTNSMLRPLGVEVKQVVAPVIRPSQDVGVRIKSMTISIDCSNKHYGEGSAAYCNLSSWLDGATLDHLPEVTDAALDLFLTCYRTVLTGMLATKLTDMGAGEYRETLAKMAARLVKLKAMLRE